MEENKITGLLGIVRPNPIWDEILVDGNKSIFRNGILYRYPGMVPMLEVQGSHYEMGLQYAVLLHNELQRYLGDLERIARWLMSKNELSLEETLKPLFAQTANILSRLPQRFVEELKGVADGSGLSLEQAAFPSLMYDVMMSTGCTGVLMRTEKGGVIHGRNNDTAGFGGEVLGPSTIIVRHKSPGFHTVTHFEFPLFLGVETGYNDQGLSFSEETLNIIKPDPDGHSLTYLVRMMLEECGDLADLPVYFDRYPVIGAYGTVWSSRRTGQGLVAELTPSGWDTNEMKDSLLWNFNHIESKKLLPQQKPRIHINPDLDREAISRSFPLKPAYNVDDALDFLGQQMGPDGVDYSHCGMRVSVCNKSASQSVVYDPDSLDFYLGVGVYYAARQNIYHVFDDFSKPPVLFREAAKMKPVVVETARIHNLLLDNHGYRDAYADLAHKYKEDAQVHFLTAYYSFLSKTLPEYGKYALAAWQIAPTITTYQLFAGLTLLLQGKSHAAADLLESLHLHEVERAFEPLRLYALQRAFQEIDPQKAISYANELELFLTEFGAKDYFESAWKPLLDPINA